MWQRFDRTWLPPVLLGAAGLALVLARLHVAGQGHVAAFILPGSRFTHAAQLPAGIATYGPNGYDGQFFYRLALAPDRLTGVVHGIALDTTYRLDRIGYPVLAWLGAGGRTGLVPWSLIAVNVAALAGVGWAGAALARGAGRHAGWGLVLAGYWGYAYSLSRDTAEIPAAFFLLAALLALHRSRPITAGVLLAGSVLVRETGMAVVAAVALVTVWDDVWGRTPRPPVRDRVRAHAAWVVPTLVFAAWLGVVRASIGSNTVGADAGANLGVPFLALGRAVHHIVTTLGGRQSEIAAAEIFCLAAVTLMAAWYGWGPRRLPGGPAMRGSTPRAAVTSLDDVDRLGWVLVLALTVSLSGAVWSGPSNYRSLDQVWLLGMLVLLRSPARLWVPAGLAAVMWTVVYVHQVVNV